MRIMRFALTGVAAAVLACVLAAGAADPASAQTASCKGRNQVLVSGQCVLDRQMESRGYRRGSKSATPPSAYEPPDRQMESRGYRRHHHRHHKS